MIDLQEVKAARDRMGRAAVHTPCLVSDFLSREAGAVVRLKMENLQSSGSFKFRGAYSYMLRVSQGGARRGVVTASSGNYGVAVALAAARAGVDATVIMPMFAPLVKKQKAAWYGATVVLEGEDYEDAVRAAQDMAAQRGLEYVPGFEDACVIAGYATLGLELVEDVPDLELVVAPVGSGGLLAGLLAAIRATNPHVKVIGVEAEGAASMQASLAEGRLVRVPTARTIADAIAVRQPGPLSFEIVSKLGDGVISVSDQVTATAMRDMALQGGLVIEPAAAAAVAGLRKLAERVGGLRAQNAVVVLSGSNADPCVVGRVMCGREPGEL